MKLGLVCHSTLGGSGVIATELAHALTQRGHEVYVISNGTPPRLRGGALHIVTSPTHELMPAGDYALALASTLAQLPLELVHAHYAIPHAVSGYLATRMRPGSDAVTAPTRYLCEQAEATFGRPVELIGNFVDTERFCPEALSAHPKTILHASNFRPLKRVGDVLAVFQRVRERVPDAQLVLVGDGPTRPEAEAQRVPNVRFVGATKDPLAFLQSADVFLFPSELESFGLAALEAMSCGVPVVATKVGGLSELVEDGQTGYLQPVGDIEGLAERVTRLLTEPVTHQRFAAAAREAATRSWRVAPKVDLYEALYRRVLNP
jgi:glycosyltransferase involved in cell wall biosynthesis